MSRPSPSDPQDAGLALQGRPFRFGLLLLSLLLLASVSGFTAGRVGDAIDNVAASLVLLAGLASMYHNRAVLIAGLLLLLPAMGTRWFFFWLEMSALAPISIGFWLLFTAFNAGALFVFIQRRGAPSNDTIYGGICIYLLLGDCFAAIFALIETLSPGSFHFAYGSPPTGAGLEIDMAYFSFVTLTTLGYGDITPVSPPAQTFATLEAVIGPMFVAVFIARLVGIRTAGD
jgi:hypothetical protein